MARKIFQMLLLLIFSSHVPKRCLGWKSHLKPIISVRNRLCYHAHGSPADSESPLLNRNDEEYGNSSGSNNREVIKGSNTGLLPTPPSPSNFPSWAYEPRDFFHFELIYQSKKSMARVGRIHTPHGIIDTPGFVAVATNGALKGIDFRDADDAGQQLVFCNTYHLLLQPGSEVVAHAGGLHKFISQNPMVKVTEEGVEFRSYRG